jgi:hypothetical protein|tara:strand:+ start:48 stop:407 length:360 start_codon:yes stop_codon:yes gene_type:complete
LKKLLNFLKPPEAFVFLLIILGVPGFLLIWLIDFEIAFWLLIFFITSGYFCSISLSGIERWSGTFLNKFRILIGWFFFFIFGCTIFIGGALILGGLFYLMFTSGGSNAGDCAPPNFYDC